MDSLPELSPSSRPSLRTLADVLSDHELLPLALRAGQLAGAFLRDQRPEDLRIDTKSTSSDAVTAMDRGAEDVIVSTILAARPDDAILGEEGGTREGRSGVRWIIDPLDGTVNYLYRIPMWGVSIAIEVDGVVVVGVVCAPDLDEDYIAVRGKGSWLVRRGRAERLSVRECTDVSVAMAVTGFGYDAERRRRQAQVVAGLIGTVRDVRRLGAAVIDFCWLARGRLDVYFEKGLNPWDVAAGGLVAREAGAVVDGLVDDDLDAFVFACVPGIAERMRAELIELKARDV